MIALAMAAGRSVALETDALVDGDAARLLTRKCIQIQAGGLLPADFDATTRYLSQPDLVQRIQQEYRRSVSKDGTVDFPVLSTGQGSYYYINENNQRTDIIEQYRRQTSVSSFDLIYYATGKRFFGKYEALIHIRAIDAGPAGTIYAASVYAYPHNGATRFLARHLGTTERYFRRKARMIARVSARICIGMDDQMTYAYRAPAPIWAEAQ